MNIEIISLEPMITVKMKWRESADSPLIEGEPVEIPLSEFLGLKKED